VLKLKVERLKGITNVSVPVTITSKIDSPKFSAPSVKTSVLWGMASDVQVGFDRRFLPALHHGRSGRFAILAKLPGEGQDVPQA